MTQREVSDGESFRSITVVLADDDAMLRRGIVHVLKRETDITIVGEAQTGDEALALAQQLRPDVLILDHGMDGPLSTDVIKHLQAMTPSPRVLVYTGYQEVDLALVLINAGATGYLVKGPDLKTFAPAVRIVASGQLYLGPIITEQMRHRFGSIANAMRHALKDDDLQMLRLLAQGKTNQQIAQLLIVTPKAIEKRLNELFACLDVQNRTQAAIRAVISGLVLQQHTTQYEDRWRER